PQGFVWVNPNSQENYAPLLVPPFTVEMVLTPTRVNINQPWGKLFGFADDQDKGWYYYQDGIESYPSATLGQGLVVANERHYIAFVAANPASPTDLNGMQVWFNGTLLGTTALNFAPPPTKAIFFRDDSFTGRQETMSGNIEAVRISST